MHPLFFALHIDSNSRAAGIFSSPEAAADYLFNHTINRDSDSGKLDWGVELITYRFHDGSPNDTSFSATAALARCCRALAEARHLARRAEEERRAKFSHFVLMLDRTPGTPAGDVVGVFSSFYRAVEYLRERAICARDAEHVGYRLLGAVTDVGAADPQCIFAPECDFTGALLHALER